MLREEFCKKCGRIFVPAAQHIYRDYKGVYCSWTCYLHRNDSKTPIKTKKVGQYTPEGDLVRIYESAKEVSELTGHPIKSIRMACIQRLTYFGHKWRYEEE